MRILLPLLVCLLALAAFAARAARGEPPRGLTLDEVFSTDRPGVWPKQIAWNRAGSKLSYLLPEEGGGEALWTLDAGSGETAVALRTGELPAGEGEKPTIDAYDWSADGERLAVLAGSDLYLYDLASHRLTRLADDAAGPRFAPTGANLAYSRGPDLYLYDMAAGKERPLTTDGEAGEVLNGQTDWVYGEEIWNRAPRGFWWSPDGRRIAFYRFDESGVKTYPLLDLVAADPDVEWQKYPRPGEPNPRVQVGIVEVATGATTWLATGGAAGDYLARVDWLPGGDRVAVQRLDRDQTHLALLLCDPATGVCTPLVGEDWPTWINLDTDLTFLADGRFLWSSERSGWRQLYLYAANGELERALTAEPLAVASLDGIDEEGGWVYYTAYSTSALGAARRRPFRVGLDGTGNTPLADDEGWHQETVAPGGKSRLDVASTADVPPRGEVLRGDGTVVAPLPAGPAPPYDPAALPSWELLTIPGPEGVPLPARLLKPDGFDPGRRYPVIMYHYGGPASQVVIDRWDTRGRDLWHKMMAQRGYVVLSVDNVASIFFGKRGEDRMHRDFGPFDVEAQLAGVAYLKSLPWVDPGRIGLWGWSGGGTNTLGALLASPGTWRAAVAGAPVTDWHLYDSIWTERYLDEPGDNPDGYAASSPITHADRLRDPLLIVHGTADDNVHPQNTIVMSQALIAAGLPFEQAIYPRQKHGFKGAAETHFYGRMTAFFDRYLMPLGAPAAGGTAEGARAKAGGGATR